MRSNPPPEPEPACREDTFPGSGRGPEGPFGIRGSPRSITAPRAPREGAPPGFPSPEFCEPLSSHWACWSWVSHLFKNEPKSMGRASSFSLFSKHLLCTICSGLGGHRGVGHRAAALKKRTSKINPRRGKGQARTGCPQILLRTSALQGSAPGAAV